MLPGAPTFASLAATPAPGPARGLQTGYQHAAAAAAAGNGRLVSSFGASQQQQMHWDMPMAMQQQQQQLHIGSVNASRSSSSGWGHSAVNSTSSCDARWQQQQFDELVVNNMQPSRRTSFDMQPSRRTSFDGPTSAHSMAHRSSFWDSGMGAGSKVRAVVTVGGSFKRAAAVAGAWVYVGGAQKVMVLPRTAAFDELLGLLSSRAEAGAAGGSLMEIKYALPGMAGSLIDLACSEDLDNMWDEWDEFIASSSNGAARLQLYVAAAASSTHSSGSSSSGGHRQLQPPTPGSTSDTGSGFVAAAAAAAAAADALRAASLPAAARSCSWDDEPAASTCGAVDAHVLLPFSSTLFAKQQGQVVQPSPWVGLHTVSIADADDCDEAAAEELKSEQFVTCFDMTAALEGDPEVAAVLAAMAAEKAAGKPVVGEVQCSSTDHRQQQQQHKGDTELEQLVAQLKGQVELIQPHELRVVRFIGGGAFGEVYLCKWNGTDVAVKCLSPSLLASSCGSSGSRSSSSSYAAGPAAELLKEAATMAAMHHPHVMSAIGVVLPPSGAMGDADDTGDADSAGPGGIRPGGCVQGPAVVCEYLSAGSLQSCINTGAEWLRSDMAKVKVMLDTARGLSYLHSKHVVHFDLKSANLLFTVRDRTPTVKVADFGLSKHRHQTYVTGGRPTGEPAAPASSTREHMLLVGVDAAGVDSMRGTLPWIAPEIIKNPELVTEAADVYSFGVIMWELWAMQEPFAGVHIHALLHQLTTQGGLSLAVPGSAAWGAKTAPPEPAPAGQS
ncbi:kinase-like domain-containing protein [Scenedesmus sp. NREL 46B-D3]|nr:kinase-like domain-containing protein [Scenedesmus sp. NREL 46B-D3]